MAGRTQRHGLAEQRIGVAIGRERHEREHVAGRLALAPDALSRARPEMHLAGRECFFERRAIRVTEHQHATVVRVLHDERDEAAALCPVDRRGETGHRRTGMPRAARNALSAPMRISPLWNTLAASAASAPSRSNTS